MALLPPYQQEKGGIWYKGTANAIFQNMQYVDGYNPEYVLILSGDHIYKMDYDKMLDFHKDKEADVTISVINVSKEEASRFGIINTRDDLSIYEFEEKSEKPKSTNASMGIYIFKWELLKQYLKDDELNINSSNDFGKDILPKMLEDNAKMVAYPFKGYWKDVGTIESLWEANMDLLNKTDELNLHEDSWKIYSQSPVRPAQYIGRRAKVVGCLVVEGCIVEGTVENSILSQGVCVGKNTVIRDSIIMPNVKIGDNVIIDKAIVGTDAVIGNGYNIGSFEKISVVAAGKILENKSVFKNNNIEGKSIELQEVEYSN